MNLLVDCIIFRKEPSGGIARLFREILPRMCDLEPNLQISLMVDGPLLQDLPSHPQIRIIKTPPVKRNIRVKGIWRYVVYPFRRVASMTWNITRSLWLGQGEGTIWHSTYYTRPSFWRGMQVVSVYDMIHENFPDLYSDPLDRIARTQKRRSINHAHAVICISETTCKDVRRYYNVDDDKLHVIPIAFNPVFRRLGSIEKNDVKFNKRTMIPEPFFLYIGTRSHHKNFLGLIDAFKNWEGNSNSYLVVVGLPWSNNEERLLKNLGMSEQVILLNNVDDQTLCILYNLASALVFPSIYEGFGIPLVEAMACGCPVVASRIPSTLEVAGEIPIYFEIHKPETFVAALDNVFQEGKTSERVIRGLERVRMYSWDRTAQQTLDIYRCLDVMMKTGNGKHG